MERNEFIRSLMTDFVWNNSYSENNTDDKFIRLFMTLITMDGELNFWDGCCTKHLSRVGRCVLVERKADVTEK